MYKCIRFRRWLPGRGLHGAGLVQFYGPSAKRRYAVGAKPPPWLLDRPEEAMHTVELTDDVVVK